MKANKGSPGIDGMNVEELPGYLKPHWPILRDPRWSGTYQAQPVRRVEIEKPDGGMRKLGIPTVLQDRKFLGFSFTAGTEPKRRVAPKALCRCKQKIRELTRRTRGISVEPMAKERATYLPGGRGYFGFCETPSVLRQLDQWIRHRLRATIWKQWKHGKVRFAKLRLGKIGTDLAAQTAGSPHGPWRLANSPALSSALPIVYFDALGIPRLFAVL